MTKLVRLDTSFVHRGEIHPRLSGIDYELMAAENDLGTWNGVARSAVQSGVGQPGRCG
jgi:hypothetical protein